MSYRETNRTAERVHAWITVGLLLLIILNIVSCSNSTVEYKECGVVVKQYESYYETSSKSHTGEQRKYLDVKYDNDRYEQEHVSTNIWYHHPKGSRVCFIEETDPSGWYVVTFLVFLLGFFISLFTYLDEYAD